MSIRFSFLAMLLMIGGCNCELETNGLEGMLGDTARADTGELDATQGCSRAFDCRGPKPPCEDLRQCGCGTFRTCQSGRCSEVSIDGCTGERDAGVFDGGPPDGSLACNAPNECGPPLARDDPWCGPNGHISGSWSCIANTCYWECDEDRICSTALPDCLECTTANGASQRSCPQTLCMIAWTSARVVASNCTGEPALTPFVGGILNLTPSQSAQCASNVSFQGGTQIVGTIRPLDDGRHYGIFPGLGGLCTGTNLFTGLERWHWSCAGCEMTWELIP